MDVPTLSSFLRSIINFFFSKNGETGDINYGNHNYGHYCFIQRLVPHVRLNFILIIDVKGLTNVFTAKWYKLTPWQFTASGDWLREHKCGQKKGLKD